MNFWKKLAAALAAGVLTVTMCPLASAAAETTGTYAEFTYVNYGSYVAITDCDSTVTEVVIPSEIDGVPVMMIEEEAFFHCSDLTAVTIPDSVKILKNRALSCENLVDITVSETHPSFKVIDGVLYGYDLARLYLYPRGKTETAYQIPETTKTIGESAFLGCDALVSLTIPETVTFISDEAFHGCSGLKELVLPPEVTYLGFATFAFCEELERVVLPEKLEYLGQGAFQSCRKLNNVVLPETLETIGSDAFSLCTSLTEISIPETVTGIGSYAFSATPWIAAQRQKNPLVIVNNILIDGYACSGIVEVPEGVTKIGGSAFSGCEGVKVIVLPETVTGIGSYAFSSCPDLTAVLIPEGMTGNLYLPFSDCDALTDVFYGGTAEAWEEINSYYQANQVPADVTVHTEAGINELAKLFCGDLNFDREVNANDAAMVLVAAVASGAGEESGLTALQTAVGNVNQNAEPDAVDAALILQYAAAAGAGEPVTWEDLIGSTD